MSDFSIGVDLGGTNLRVAAVSREGALLEKVSVAAKVDLGPAHVVDEMCDAIQRLSHVYKTAGNFIGAGIGVPGVIDMESGTMRKAVNLPGFENYPVRAEIERRLGVPIVLENDARAAALGEQWLGAARGVANVALLTLGTGIGGGLVLDGNIRHGVNGMAGEFGHVSLESDGYPCSCGNRGCAEKYASASAILRMTRESIAAGSVSLARVAASDRDFGVKPVYELAAQGDEDARKIFVTFGRYLGILLVNLINVLDLEMFVIGGGVSSAWDAFAPAMFAEVRKRSLICAAATSDSQAEESPEKKKFMAGEIGGAGNTIGRTIITRALLGGDAGLYGAARIAALAA